MAATKSLCGCGHAQVADHKRGGGCAVCSCDLNKAGQAMLKRKCYVPADNIVMYVDPALEYGPWNTRTGLL